MKRLWKFHWCCGRAGDVDGVFVATKDEVEAALGETVYFGEILGKHSEIYGALEQTDLTEIDCDEDFIKRCVDIGLVPSGYNPLDYINRDE